MQTFVTWEKISEMKVTQLGVMK